MMPVALLLVDGGSRRDLVALAHTKGLDVVEVLETGANQVRDALDQVRLGATNRCFQALLVETLDISNIGPRRLLRELDGLRESGAQIVSLREPFLTLQGDQGQLVSWLHQKFETERRANIAAGMAKSRRRPGRPKVELPVEKILDLDAKGASLRQIARITKRGASTIQRFLAAWRAKNPDHQESRASGV